MMHNEALEFGVEKDTKRFIRYLAVGVALFPIDFAVLVVLPTKEKSNV
jgi:putative flippase GtrA